MAANDFNDSSGYADELKNRYATANIDSSGNANPNIVGNPNLRHATQTYQLPSGGTSSLPLPTPGVDPSTRAIQQSSSNQVVGAPAKPMMTAQQVEASDQHPLGPNANRPLPTGLSYKDRLDALRGQLLKTGNRQHRGAIQDEINQMRAMNPDGTPKLNAKDQTELEKTKIQQQGATDRTKMTTEAADKRNEDMIAGRISVAQMTTEERTRHNEATEKMKRDVKDEHVREFNESKENPESPAGKLALANKFALQADLYQKKGNLAMELEARREQYNLQKEAAKADEIKNVTITRDQAGKEIARTESKVTEADPIAKSESAVQILTKKGIDSEEKLDEIFKAGQMPKSIYDQAKEAFMIQAEVARRKKQEIKDMVDQHYGK